MVTSLTSRQWQIWIALFAVLLNALAPSVSHAVAAARGPAPAWEMCSADRTGYAGPASAAFAAFVAAEQPPAAAAPEGSGKAGEHCAYCLPHAGDFALAPAVAAPAGVVGRHPPHPFLLYRAPRPLTAWSAARPRGPPAPA
ncbi:DUF2946 domain-containing protein [Janthinobacterium sp. CG_23.3]|uniref:DUF2946 domain-containing protein n=1 Tax=Janthinobacterium sp. CG_23.3 TaxID=3349634 RepID=UPI0038D4458F